MAKAIIGMAWTVDHKSNLKKGRCTAVSVFIHVHLQVVL